MAVTRRELLFGLGVTTALSSSTLRLAASIYGAGTLDQATTRSPQSAMTTFKLSVLTDEISQDFDRALAVASREFGMRHVDLREAHGKNLMKWDASEIAEIRRLLDRYDMRVACLASPIYKVDWPDAPRSQFSPKNPLRDEFGADFTFKDQAELLDRAFDLARTFKTDRIRIFDFWRLDDQAPHRAAIDETIRKASIRAGKHNLTLVIENEPACNTATGAEAARLLDAIREPALELTWDPGNAVTRGETPYPDGYAKLPKNRIGHMHCKDAVRRADGSGWEWMAMGRGVIDWAAQFRALKKDGYRGAATLETHWRGAGTPEESSRQSWAGMKALLEKAEAL
jgi:L-ribulose-5-phosphate 3-epimerase